MRVNVCDSHLAIGRGRQSRAKARVAPALRISVGLRAYVPYQIGKTNFFQSVKAFSISMAVQALSWQIDKSIQFGN